MTAPPKSLGTKDRHPLPLTQPQKLFHPALEFLAQHVVRIIAESWGIPSFVRGSLSQTLFAISPKFPPKPNVTYARFLQSLSQRFSGEMGMVSRAWESPNISHRFDPVGGKEL